MISKEELRLIARKKGLNLGQAEKNYLHIITLHAIAKIAPEKLVFKGGTALMICHSLDRFSEDLDFTAIKEFDAEQFLHLLLKQLGLFGVKAQILLAHSTPISNKYLVRYQDPLYAGTQQTTAKVELDISTREMVIRPTNTSRIIHDYPDTPSFYLQTMSLEEVFAEKIRAVFTRDKARDLFDLEFLLLKKVVADVGLIDQKLSYYDLRFDTLALERAIDKKKLLWEPELKNLVDRIPDFEAVKKAILEAFS